ncbi:MAG: hypothetical protein P8Y63_01720 [Deltaproteobacteria bacterium]
MNNIHELLIEGKTFAVAEQKALRFFARNLLARYEEAQVVAEASCSARHPDFWNRLTTGLAENRRRAADLVVELEEAGLTHMNQLRELSQGYESKILHTLAHLLDGFFGVDSYFYNLLDDSHGISEARRRLIREDPDSYGLLRVATRTGTGGENPFADLRRQAKNI